MERPAPSLRALPWSYSEELNRRGSASRRSPTASVDFEMISQATELLRPNVGSGTINLAHRIVFARSPCFVPLAACSLLRAADRRVRVPDGTPLAPAPARLAGAPSLLSRLSGRDPGGSSDVLPACVGHPTRLRVPGASRRTLPGTLLRRPRKRTLRIPARLRHASVSSTDRSAGLVLLLSLRHRVSQGDYAGKHRGSAPPLGAYKSPLLASFLLDSATGLSREHAY